MYFFGMNVQNPYGFWGSAPDPAGELTTLPRPPIVARGSCLRQSQRLQFPHGLKSNYIKERWLMRLGGICARGLGGDRRPCRQLISCSIFGEIQIVPL